MPVGITDLMFGEFPESAKKTLRDQTIGADHPGTVLADFQTLIDFVGVDGLATSSRHFSLPQGRLAELNERMSEPLPQALKRPQLRSFPTLMGLFLLLRASGLGIGQTKPKRRLAIDPQMLAQWNSLSATERYMTLLDTWLCQATWDIAGQRSWSSAGILPDVHRVYASLPEERTSVERGRYELFYGIEQSVTASLLHAFGWLRLEYESQPSEGKTAAVETVLRLPFGDAMLALTSKTLGFGASRNGPLQQALQPFFPEWKRNLELPEPEFRAGEHTLKVSLAGPWRRIVTPADTTLEQLVHAILDAFRFDHDHLYRLEHRSARGQEVTVACPELDDAEQWADETRVGDVPIAVGESIRLLYDFGDCWLFTITFEKISDRPSKRSGPKVTQASGTAPDQYGDGED